MLTDIKKPKSKVYKQAFDIVILAGQSNAVGCGRGKTGYSPSEAVWELYREERFNIRKNPQWPRRQYRFRQADFQKHNLSGFYLYFGRRYEKELLAVGRRLLFLRVAVGGTGFSDGCWGKNDHLYKNAVEMIRLVREGNPKNRVVGILWHQGESDVMNGMTQAQYSENLSGLIKGLREVAGGQNVPFVAGDMVETWYREQPNAENIRKGTQCSLTENENCAFVSSAGLTGNPKEDCIHFSTADNEIFGERYFEAFCSLL